jgi:hypothetical protein
MHPQDEDPRQQADGLFEPDSGALKRQLDQVSGDIDRLVFEVADTEAEILSRLFEAATADEPDVSVLKVCVADLEKARELKAWARARQSIAAGLRERLEA